MVKSSVHFSPRAVAKAIGVSESSLKRWCDAGKISAMKTAGGHRRMAHSDIISFLRSQKISLQNPEAVGLPIFDSQVAHDSTVAQQRFMDGLLTSDNEKCRDLLVHLFVNQWPIERICDDVVNPVIERLYEMVSRGEISAAEKNQILDCCLSGLRKIRSFSPEVSLDAPKAVCVDFRSTQFHLPIESTALVLAANGWCIRPHQDFADLESIQLEVLKERVDLLFVACSYSSDVAATAAKLNELSDGISPSTGFVVDHGGNMALQQSLKSAICCNSQTQLVAIANKLKSTQPMSNGFASNN